MEEVIDSCVEEVIDSCFSGDTTTGITSLPSHVISSYVLTKLDGPSIASLSCLSRQLYALSLEENIWKNICNYTFPSTTDPLVRDTISKFPSGYRSFYFDTFPTHPTEQSKIKIKNYGAGETPELIPELIYAVDVKFGDRLLYSKVVVTNTQNSGFVLPPFCFDLMGKDEFFQIPVKFSGEQSRVIKPFDGEQSQVKKTLEEKLKVSWILIDPTRKKAINLSSNVLVDVLYGTGDIFLVYATVMVVAGVDAGYEVVVECKCNGGGELCVTKISLQPKGISTEGKVMNEKGILLEILQEAMKGKRRTPLLIAGEEEKKRYENFFVTGLERYYKRYKREVLLKKRKKEENNRGKVLQKKKKERRITGEVPESCNADTTYPNIV